MDDKTYLTLKGLEESLWRAETRLNDTLMDDLFADDFCEFGRSGKIYDREDMFLDGRTTVKLEATFPLRDFHVRPLSDDIIQVTYVSEVRYGAQTDLANRSSLWRRREGGWELCFHQGTPTDQL